MSKLRLGFSKGDITPRVGVELCGFGPFLNRHSTSVRDPLWARAMAMESDGKQAVVITCDLVCISRETTRKVRKTLNESCGLAPADVMICCSHTHSGPATGEYIGWGAPDQPYLETLHLRIAAAAREALNRLQTADLYHTETPCEGIGLNREYDQDAPPLESVMKNSWRPAKPELTDTTCHVLSARTPDGRLIGFMSYFGCHPVVCCAANHQIHGDYPGVATNLVERDHDDVVGLFLQGAQGDVNSCVVHKPEQESLLALDVIAGRYARALRQGILDGRRVPVSGLQACRREVVFTRKHWSREEIQRRLSECERIIATLPKDCWSFSDAPHDVRMQTVYAIALRNLLDRHARGETLTPATELHGLRLGPVTLLGSPFETFQAIKREVVNGAGAPVTLVVSFVNDSTGYAVDETCAARGGYAADMVPLICGELPFAGIHRELVRELLELNRSLGA